MNEILNKYIAEIKAINSCGADVVMDSVWIRLLGNFYTEVSQHLNQGKVK